MVMAALVAFLAWIRNVAQAEKRALLGCRRGFVNPLTINFLIARGVLRRGQTPQNL